MKARALLCLFWWTGVVGAGEPVTLSWTAPSVNADGSTPVTVGGYNLYQDTTDAGLTAQGNTTTGVPVCTGTVINKCALSVGNVLAFTFPNVAPGSYVWAVTAWYCPSTGKCVESVQSAHVSATITIAAPGPPEKVKVTITVPSP
jgi:hypothetical protein